jgi:hypothetical protein
MKTFRKLIEILTALETAFLRRKAARRASRAAVRMALRGCRV